ncbi:MULTISPECIES: class I SAM-dependent methyltransferase [Microbacterium]|uniref:class I SAM-dependent methyltransferase n=1 Tax=Microbacterium TaxID=33882 RepID=UPI001EF63683|nr:MULTISPECIES: class I SAM-dependent methyltransferase [Microbacterium]
MSTDAETPDPEAVDQPFWLSPASFWMPTHYPLSAWFTHAPFASWLVDSIRPRRIVELGTHLGFSCFAFAEAASRLGLPTTVDAVDSWEGDDHAGFYDESVFESVRTVVEQDFPRTVVLNRGWFSDVRPRVADQSVDILHIDGRHGYEDATEDYEQWRSSVADGGVILFHDIAERERGFGVWRLWEEIAEPGRSFFFEHGHGLGLLAVGDIRYKPISRLCGADEETAAKIRGDFSRLGDRVHRQAWLESLPAELDRVNALAHERSLQIDQTAAALEAERQYVQTIKASTSWRITAPLRAVGKLRPHRA